VMENSIGMFHVIPSVVQVCNSSSVCSSVCLFVSVDWKVALAFRLG